MTILSYSLPEHGSRRSLPAAMKPPLVAMLVGAAAIVCTLLEWSIEPSNSTNVVVISVLLGGIAASAFTDLRSRRVLNSITYPMLLFALLTNPGVSCLENNADATQATLHVGRLIGFAESLGGAAACFAAMFAIYRVAGGGAGDVKLATPIGALVGPMTGLTIIVWCYIAAGIATLAWIVWQRGPIGSLAMLGRSVGQVLLPQRFAASTDAECRLMLVPVPLAVFFAIGTVITLSRVIP